MPGIKVVWPALLDTLFGVALEAVRDNDSAVVACKVLNQRVWGLDDVGVEPEHPGSGGAEGGVQEGVPGAGHCGAASLLRGEGMALLLVLRDRRVEILADNGDSRESVLLGTGLHSPHGILQFRQRRVTLAGLGHDETEVNEIVRVIELQQVRPVCIVEAGEGCQQEDLFAVLDRGRGGGEVVEIVVDYGGSGGGGAVTGFRFGGGRRPVGGGDEEYEESEEEDETEDEGYGIGTAEGAGSHSGQWWWL